jgi:hypothetical protein
LSVPVAACVGRARVSAVTTTVSCMIRGVAQQAAEASTHLIVGTESILRSFHKKNLSEWSVVQWDGLLFTIQNALTALWKVRILRSVERGSR